METTSDRHDRAARKRMFEGLLTRYSVAQNYPPMSEQELVKEAIRFANATPDTDDFLRFLPLSMAAKMPYKNFRKVLKERRRPPPYQQERNAFRIGLTEIARGDELSHPDEIAEAAGRMLLIPVASFQGRQLQVAYRYLPQDLTAALAYVLLLFADPTQGYGRDLRQCQLDRCQKFFFILRPKTGRPRKTYCSDEHMQEAHQASASERVKKSRARRRANKAKRRRKG